MSQLDFSEKNVENSVATYLAAQLLAAGWLVYWQERDALETEAGYYAAYSQYVASASAYPSGAAVSTALAEARGVLTLRGKVPANPRFVTRPSSSGAVTATDEVCIPAFAIALDPTVPLTDYELGSTLKFRGRHLLLFGFASTTDERADLADYLSAWFDSHTPITVLDHKAGTLAEVGDVSVEDPTVLSDIELKGPLALTYAVELNARLEFIA